jgi:hypothetical protein
LIKQKNLNDIPFSIKPGSWNQQPGVQKQILQHPKLLYYCSP